MKDRFGNRVSPPLLAAYVDGDVTPSQAAAVERAMAESPDLRRRAEGLRHIKQVLSAPVPELQDVDLAGAVRLSVQREQWHPARARGGLPRRAWTFGVGAMATGAALALVLLVRAPHGRPGSGDADLSTAAGEFRAKSAAPSGAAAAARWAGINVYYVAGAETPRLKDRLPPGAGLLFSYSNSGAQAFEYLMVFAVDAAGEVRWFFPAYETAGTDPASIAIEKGRSNVPLQELIDQPLPQGPVVLHALFSHRPLKVLEVEAWLREHPAGTTPPPWPDVYQQLISTSVATAPDNRSPTSPRR